MYACTRTGGVREGVLVRVCVCVCVLCVLCTVDSVAFDSSCDGTRTLPQSWGQTECPSPCGRCPLWQVPPVAGAPCGLPPAAKCVSAIQVLLAVIELKTGLVSSLCCFNDNTRH